MTVNSILLLLLCCVHVHAGLFSTRNPYISATSITLFSNTSDITILDPSGDSRDYKQNIVPNTNLTQPDESGLSAVLYDRGISCGLNDTTAVPYPVLLTTQPKIALVKKGLCSFQEKAYNSQLDGALGMIIYDDIAFEDDIHAGIMDIPPGVVTIPVYYVDLSIGVDLLQRLQRDVTVMMTPENVSTQPAVRVTLYPSVGGIPNAWEFTLIVVIVLLAVSFLVSIVMHWHLWRIRRRQRAIYMYENGILPMNVPGMAVVPENTVISPELLSVFPTRIIGQAQSEQTSPATAGKDGNRMAASSISKRPSFESMKSTRSGKALENAEALAAKEPVRVEIQVASQKSEEEDITGQRKTNELSRDDDDACVICLDEFATGEQVRRLPCGHEYHCECIDPWLTIKSASCPLCKHDCTLDLPKHNNEEATSASPSPSPPSPAVVSESNGSRYMPFFGPLLRAHRNAQGSHSSFGPTIPADRAEEFSRSWMARSLPRNMRRQLNLAAEAAMRDNTAIELPARMTVQDSSEPSTNINVSETSNTLSFRHRITNTLSGRRQTRR